MSQVLAALPEKEVVLVLDPICLSCLGTKKFEMSQKKFQNTLLKGSRNLPFAFAFRSHPMRFLLE